MQKCSCAVCDQSETGKSSLLQCRGCGYAVHSHCHLGERLCPDCANSLTAAVTAGESHSDHTTARRRIEYRLTGLVVTGGFMILSSGPMLALAGHRWHWLSIPFGTLLLLVLAAAGAVFGGKFLRGPDRTTALLAISLFTLASLLFVPGAYTELMPWASSNRIAMVLAVVVALTPLALVPLAWRELHRWKQLPGTSARSGWEGRESMFGEAG